MRNSLSSLSKSFSASRLGVFKLKSSDAIPGESANQYHTTDWFGSLKYSNTKPPEIRINSQLKDFIHILRDHTATPKHVITQLQHVIKGINNLSIEEQNILRANLLVIFYIAKCNDQPLFDQQILNMEKLKAFYFGVSADDIDTKNMLNEIKKLILGAQMQQECFNNNRLEDIIFQYASVKTDVKNKHFLLMDTSSHQSGISIELEHNISLYTQNTFGLNQRFKQLTFDQIQTLQQNNATEILKKINEIIQTTDGELKKPIIEFYACYLSGRTVVDLATIQHWNLPPLNDELQSIFCFLFNVSGNTWSEKLDKTTDKFTELEKLLCKYTENMVFNPLDSGKSLQITIEKNILVKIGDLYENANLIEKLIDALNEKNINEIQLHLNDILMKDKELFIQLLVIIGLNIVNLGYKVKINSHEPTNALEFQMAKVDVIFYNGNLYRSDENHKIQTVSLPKDISLDDICGLEDNDKIIQLEKILNNLPDNIKTKNALSPQCIIRFIRTQNDIKNLFELMQLNPIFIRYVINTLGSVQVRNVADKMYLLTKDEPHAKDEIRRNSDPLPENLVHSSEGTVRPKSDPISNNKPYTKKEAYLFDYTNTDKPEFINEGQNKYAISIKKDWEHAYGIVKDPKNTLSEAKEETLVENIIAVKPVNEQKILLPITSTQDYQLGFGDTVFRFQKTGVHVKNIFNNMSSASADSRKEAALEIIKKLYYTVILLQLYNLPHGDLHLNNFKIMFDENTQEYTVTIFDFGYRKHNETFMIADIDLKYLLVGRPIIFKAMEIIGHSNMEKHYPDEKILKIAGFELDLRKTKIFREYKALLWVNIQKIRETEYSKNTSIETEKRIHEAQIIALEKFYFFMVKLINAQNETDFKQLNKMTELLKPVRGISVAKAPAKIMVSSINVPSVELS